MPNLLQRLTQHLRRRFLPSPNPPAAPLEPTCDRLCYSCNSPCISAEHEHCERCERTIYHLQQEHDEDLDALLWSPDAEAEAEKQARFDAAFEEARQLPLTSIKRHEALDEIQAERERLDALELGHLQAFKDRLASA